NHNGADVFKDGIPGQDDYGTIADRRGELSPPDLATLHASSVSHLEIGGNSLTSSAWVSATWFGSTSEIAVASRYCRTASSMSSAISRFCLLARSRSCSSTMLGRSIVIVGF